MNNRIIKIVSFLQLPPLLFPFHLLYADTSSSPLPSPIPSFSPTATFQDLSTSDACTTARNACSFQQTSSTPSPGASGSPVPLSNSALIQMCGPYQPPDQPNSPIINGTNVYATWEQCKESLAQEFGQLTQDCRALSLYDNGYNMTMAAAITYGVTAGICLTACVASATPVGPAAELACSVAGLGASIADTVMTQKLTVEGKGFTDQHEAVVGFTSGLGFFGSVFGIGGGAASLLTGGDSVSRLNSAYQARSSSVSSPEGSPESTSTSSGSKSTSATSEGKTSLTTEGETLATDGESAVEDSSNAGKGSMKSRILICNTAALFAVAAALRATNCKLTNQARNAECATISSLPGVDKFSQIPDTVPTSTGNSGNNGQPNAPGNGTSMGIAGSMQGTANISQGIYSNPGQFPSGIYSDAALGGPMGSLLQQMPNKDQIPDVLKNLGLSFATVGSRLASQPAGAVIAGMVPDLPPEMAAGLKHMDELNSRGALSMGAVSSTLSAGGSALRGGSAGTANLFGGMFGSKGVSGSAKSPEISFDPKKEDAHSTEVAGGDIWHSSWNGSIFQIITSKLIKARDRVDQLEWATPLNRALAGLPQEKPIKKSGLIEAQGKK